MTIADVQPTSGRLCGGTWNRNSGGGIPDFTYCIPTNKSGIAYISASADGVTSNPLPVFVHPVVTSIVLGGPSSNCTTDPTTACCPLATVGAVTAPPYLANSCLSQGSTAQLVARVFAGTGTNQTNISCQAGHLQLQRAGRLARTTPLARRQHRPERRGHRQSARISADHGEYCERRQFRGLLLHLSAGVHHAYRAWGPATGNPAIRSL